MEYIKYKKELVKLKQNLAKKWWKKWYSNSLTHKEMKAMVLDTEIYDVDMKDLINEMMKKRDELFK